MIVHSTVQNQHQNLSIKKPRSKNWSLPFWHLSSFGRNHHLYMATSISNVQDSGWALPVMMWLSGFVQNLVANLEEKAGKEVRHFQHLWETEAKLVSHFFEGYAEGKRQKSCNLEIMWSIHFSINYTCISHIYRRPLVWTENHMIIWFDHNHYDMDHNPHWFLLQDCYPKHTVLGVNPHEKHGIYIWVVCTGLCCNPAQS